MSHNKRFKAVALALLGLSAVALLPGCSSAKADPLEVTYYYLPG